MLIEGVFENTDGNKFQTSLNPYSTGRCSLSLLLRSKGQGCRQGLNPYSTGRCSLRPKCVFDSFASLDGLNPYSTGRCSLRSARQITFVENKKVLILILLEDAH